MSFYEINKAGPIRQGELLRDVVEYRLESSATLKGQPALRQVRHPLCVVLNADCDLEWDHKERQKEEQSPGKIVPYLTLYDLFKEDEIRSVVGNSSAWRAAKQKQNVRFHVLPQSILENGNELPNLFVDFKRFFAVPTQAVYLGMKEGAIIRECVLTGGHLYDLIQRCYAFQSRIGIRE